MQGPGHRRPGVVARQYLAHDPSRGFVQSIGVEEEERVLGIEADEVLADMTYVLLAREESLIPSPATTASVTARCRSRSAGFHGSMTLGARRPSGFVIGPFVAIILVVPLISSASCAIS
ncbi:hypothetical protein diail_3866 [Diaporthe ilicicola]|nr:hypothetical protein diail_3866 [Diaporthe ilicicola]